MKTTIEISNELLQKARELASEEETTLDELVEEGLRRVVNERSTTLEFRLRKVTVDGNGLQPEVEGMSWRQIREISYGDRGG